MHVFTTIQDVVSFHYSKYVLLKLSLCVSPLLIYHFILKIKKKKFLFLVISVLTSKTLSLLNHFDFVRTVDKFKLDDVLKLLKKERVV